MKPGQMHGVIPFDPPLPVETPDGPGLAYFIRDYGLDHDDWWTVVPSSGPRRGQFRTYKNPDVRAVENETVGRTTAVPKAEAPATKAVAKKVPAKKAKK